MYTAPEIKYENRVADNYYYESGEKFYVLTDKTSDPIENIIYEVSVNEKIKNKDDYIELITNSDGIIELSIKEDVNSPFHLVIYGYRNNNEWPNEIHYNLYPSTGIMICDYIDSYWDREQEKEIVEFSDYGEYNHSEFNSSIECEVKNTRNMALAYVERHKDGSVYVESIDPEACSLTINGKEVEVGDYFEYLDIAEYSIGGKYENCPEALNGEYRIYRFRSLTAGTFALTYTKDDKSYVYSFECVLPRVGIYSKNERSDNTLIDSFDYSSTNKTVYMLTGEKDEDQADLEIINVRIHKDFEGRELSEDEIKEYVTVTKVTNGYKLEFTDKIADCNYVEFGNNYGGCGLQINDCRPGLRICDWIDTWDVIGFHYENEEDFATFKKLNADEYRTYKDRYIFALAYTKDSKYAPLKLSDIKVTLNGVNVIDSLELVAENIEYKFDSNNKNSYNIYALNADQVGDYIISYDPTPKDTKNKDVVTMTISCRLPEIAAYSNEIMSTDSYLGYNISINENNNIFYLLCENIEDYRFESSVYYYFDDNEVAVALETYFDFDVVANGRKVTIKNIDTLIDSELYLKAFRHACWDGDESCPGREFCDNYWEECTFYIGRLNDPMIAICDNFNIDWISGRFIGFNQDSDFWWPEDNERFLYVNEDYYVSFTYREETGNGVQFTPLTLDKIKVYKDGKEIDSSTVFTIISKDLPFNEYDQEGLGNKYDVYKLSTDKAGVYVVKYDPDPSNDTDEDAAVINFRVSVEDFSFYSKPEISDENYLGSSNLMIAAIGSENNVLYLKTSNPEANYKIYTILYDDFEGPYFGDVIYDSADPADKEAAKRTGVKFKVTESGMLEISYNGLFGGLDIAVQDEDADENIGFLPKVVADFNFMTLNMNDANIKSACALGEEVKNNSIYIDYYDNNGMYMNVSAADIEKLGYTLKFEYVEFMPEPYTVEPDENGKLILTVPGLYRWNLYKGDELYAEGHKFVEVFKNLYTPALGKEIEIAGIDYADEDELTRNYSQAIKVFTEADKTYKITIYPSDNTVEDYERYVGIEGIYFTETEQFEHGVIGEGTAKYIFFRAPLDNDVLIKPHAGCKEKIKIEKCSEIFHAEIIAPDYFEYWSDGENYIGAAPEDMAKVLVYLEEGVQEYDMPDILSFLETAEEYYGEGKKSISYYGQIGSISVEPKYFDVVVLPESPEITFGANNTKNGFYRINLVKDKYYDIKIDDISKSHHNAEEELRILLMYQDEDGNIDTVFDKDCHSINIKADKTGTYFLLVDGLNDDDKFVVREGKKTVELISYDVNYETVYGFTPEISYTAGGANVYYDEELISSFYLRNDEDLTDMSAYYGFKCELVKEDKVTVAKKDAKGFYPVGNYYFRFTVDANYDTEPVYSDPVRIIATDSKYTIVYHVNGKTIKQANIAPNTVFNLKANTEIKKGYTFLGWAVSLDEENEITEEIIIHKGDESPVYYTDKQKVSNVYGLYASSNGLWAVWELNEYTVEYNNLYGTDVCVWDDGRIVPRVQTYTVEDETVELLNPSITVPDYSGFGGWYSDPNYVNEVTEIKPSDAKNYVLYAKKLVPAYTITFVSNDGTDTEISKLTVHDGMEIQIPACSYKNAGYAFTSWSNLSEGGMELFSGNEKVRLSVSFEGPVTAFTFVDVEEDTISNVFVEGNDITLYAHWSNNFNIVYHNISGTEYTDEDVSVTQPLEYNKKFTTLLKPTRTGYTFAGWYNEEGKKVTSITAKGEKETYHLYAKWTARSYNVKFDKNGASGSMTSQKLTFDKAAKLKANKFSRPGFIFVGWSKTKYDALGKGPSYVVHNYTDEEEVTNVSGEGKDITLYAVWKETDYKIYFDPCCESGEIVGDMTPVTYSYSKLSGETLPVISRDGYTFKGWYKDAKYSKAVSTTKGLAANMTVYAKWAANYSIVFYGNGADGKMSALNNVKLNDTKKLTKNAFTYKDELGNKYAFLGWSRYPYDWDIEFTNEAKIKISSPDDLVNENGKLVLNLYAVWRKDFTVTYLTKDGSLANNVDFYVYGTGIKSLPTPVRDGYTFGGWYKDEKFKTKKVTSISATNVGDVELYAKWTGSKYSITFNANAPEGTKATGKMKAESLVYGTQKALTKNAFKVTGYKFVGWSKYPIGAVRPEDDYIPDFVNSEKVDSIYNMYKNKVTLYAVWEYVPSYVTVCVNGAEDFSFNIDDEARIGETVTLDEINREFRDDNGNFYYYDKLYTDKSCKKLFKGTKITSGEIKLYAKKRVQINY